MFIMDYLNYYPLPCLLGCYEWAFGKDLWFSQPNHSWQMADARLVDVALKPNELERYLHDIIVIIELLHILI